MAFEYQDFRVEPRCVLGEGAFGQVVMGVDKKKKCLVAVKKIAIKDADGVETVMKEIIALNKVPRHENVVQLLTSFFDKSAASFWLIFDFCDMGDLAEYYEKYKPGPNSTVEIMAQISKAVAFMHGLPSKIMHRDLKPQNVMMTYLDQDRPIAKLADFGLAKVQQDELGMTLAQTFMAGTQCGTPCFLAPEIFIGINYSCSVDVFSTGLLFLGLINFKRKGRIFPMPDEVDVPVMFRQSPIGMMLIQCLQMHLPVPDLAKSRPDDPPIFSEVKKVVRQMIKLESTERITAQQADIVIQKLFTTVKGKLEKPPAKPTRKLPPAIQEVMGGEVKKSTAGFDEGDLGYMLLGQLLRQMVAHDEAKSGDDDEMPLLAALGQLHRAMDADDEGPFKIGEKVRVESDKERAIGMQKGYGGWNKAMEKHLGAVGTVIQQPKHVVRVQFSNEEEFSWNPNLLESVEGGAGRADSGAKQPGSSSTFKLMDIVQITKDEAKAKTLQKGHGGWNPVMVLCLGIRGVVKGVDSDGDVKVVTFIDSKPWIWHPELLEKVDTSGEELEAGDIVVVSDDRKQVEDMQKTGGGWIPEMRAALGQIGVIRKKSKSAAFHVEVVGTRFFFNPSALKLIAKSTEVVAALMKKKKLKL